MRMRRREPFIGPIRKHRGWTRRSIFNHCVCYVGLRQHYWATLNINEAKPKFFERKILFCIWNTMYVLSCALTTESADSIISVRNYSRNGVKLVATSKCCFASSTPDTRFWWLIRRKYVHLDTAYREDSPGIWDKIILLRFEKAG